MSNPAPSKNSPPKKNNRLCLEQRIRLLDLIRSKREKLTSGNLTKADAMMELSREAGFLIPESSLQETAKAGGIEVKWKRVGNTVESRGKTSRILAKAIRDLYQSLGVPCPNDVLALANGVTIASDGSVVLPPSPANPPSPSSLDIARKKFEELRK